MRAYFDRQTRQTEKALAGASSVFNIRQAIPLRVWNAAPGPPWSEAIPKRLQKQRSRDARF